MTKLATLTGILLSFAAFARCYPIRSIIVSASKHRLHITADTVPSKKAKPGFLEQDVFFNSRRKLFMAADIPAIHLVFRERWEAIGSISFIEYGLDRQKMTNALKSQFAGSYFEEEPQYENKANISFEYQVFTLGAGYLFRKKKNRFHAYLLCGYD